VTTFSNKISLKNKKRRLWKYSKDRRFICGTTLIGLNTEKQTHLSRMPTHPPFFNANAASDITCGLTRFPSAFKSPFANPVPAALPPAAALCKDIY